MKTNIRWKRKKTGTPEKVEKVTGQTSRGQLASSDEWCVPLDWKSDFPRVPSRPRQQKRPLKVRISARELRGTPVNPSLCLATLSKYCVVYSIYSVLLGGATVLDSQQQLHFHRALAAWRSSGSCVIKCLLWHLLFVEFDFGAVSHQTVGLLWSK